MRVASPESVVLDEVAVFVKVIAEKRALWRAIAKRAGDASKLLTFGLRCKIGGQFLLAGSLESK